MHLKRKKQIEDEDEQTEKLKIKNYHFGQK